MLLAEMLFQDDALLLTPMEAVQMLSDMAMPRKMNAPFPPEPVPKQSLYSRSTA